MAIHPVVAEFIATLPHHDGPPDPAAIRAGDEARVKPLAERMPIHSVRDAESEGVPVRIYTPSASERHPVIVYFHGGAFFLGSLNTHDHVCRELANATRSLVVSVGYRLAPEHAFPAGLTDCYASVRKVVEHADHIGWDGHTLAIAGDSSGGNYVAAVAAMAHDDAFDAITHQILYYPSVDLDFDTERYESLRINAVGYGLETAGLKPFNAFYVNSGADPADPLVSPIKRADLSGLPPALIVTAEYDPLRDEGEQYGARLAAAGVPTTVRRWESAGHGFVQHFGWLPEFHPVYSATAAFLRGDEPV